MNPDVRVHGLIREHGSRRNRHVLDEHLLNPTAGSTKAVATIYRSLVGVR